MASNRLRLSAMLAAAAVLAFAPGPAFGPGRAMAQGATAAAFLGVFIENDNAAFEPTSDAERARAAKVEEQFKSLLEASGDYKFVPVTAAMRSRIAAGQAVGRCAGCELSYGRELGVSRVAWIEVQKISNLILNMNVYVTDVASGKSVVVHSVDIRGNTDESWSRSLTYLVKNYVLSNAGAGG